MDSPPVDLWSAFYLTFCISLTGISLVYLILSGLAMDWYQLDTNSVPAHYRIAPLDASNYREYQVHTNTYIYSSVGVFNCPALT